MEALRSGALHREDRPVERRPCILVQRLAQPLVVELFAEAVEPALLRRQVADRGFGSLGLLRSGAFVPAVLLRVAGLDQLRSNSRRLDPQ
jgi:hypothetical protein